MLPSRETARTAVIQAAEAISRSRLHRRHAVDGVSRATTDQVEAKASPGPRSGAAEARRHPSPAHTQDGLDHLARLRVGKSLLDLPIS
jgi:hypothetical protein